MLVYSPQFRGLARSMIHHPIKVPEVSMISDVWWLGMSRKGRGGHGGPRARGATGARAGVEMEEGPAFSTCASRRPSKSVASSSMTQTS